MEQPVTRRRWVIVAMLTGFSIVSYLERTNISIAATFMKQEFALTDVQMGQIFSSFLLGYALFQVAAGRLGDVLGPRIVLSGAAVVWGVTTALTGLLPGVLVGSTLGVFLVLAVLRFSLGVAESATYPVAARAVANWVRVTERATAESILIAGASIGAALTGPLISWLMVTAGWRQSFFVASTLAFGIAALWYLYATDRPEQHRRVSPSELALITADRPPEARSAETASWWRLFRDRNVVLVSLSYFAEGYVLYIFVFWLYTYLVTERGFGILAGGVFSALPWIVSAVLTPLGGVMSDALCARHGRRWGRRVPVMIGFTVSAAMLFLGATVASPYLAIAALALAVGMVMFTEAAFWAATIDLGGRHAGSATGILNTVGNLGGVVSSALVPVLVAQFGWLAALGTGSLIALVAAALWLWIRADQDGIDRPGT